MPTDDEGLKTTGFGNNLDGEMFNVPDYGTPVVPETFGLNSDFGSDPNGEIMGAPAPEKLGVIEQSYNMQTIGNPSDAIERPFSSLKLSHTFEEGSQGPLPGGSSGD